MRCAQPFIPIARGRLAKPILQFRGFPLANNDFCQHIANKYSRTKLGKFKFSALTLLERISSEWTIFNTTQNLKYQVIYASPPLSQLNFNLNILFSLDTVFKTLLGGESKLQKLDFNRFAFSNNSENYLTKIYLSEVSRLTQIEQRQFDFYSPKLEGKGLEVRFERKLHTALFNNTVMPRFVQRESKSKTSQSGRWTLLPSSTILITRTKIPNLFVHPPEAFTNQKHSPREVLFNSIKQTILLDKNKSQPQSLLPGKLTFSPSSAISITKSTVLITRASLPQFSLQGNIGMRQKEQLSRPDLLLPPKSDAVAVEIPELFRQQQPENITYRTHSVDLEKPNSQPQITFSQPESPALLIDNKKYTLVHLANINRIASTIERTSHLIQRLQTIETLTILQYRKAANNSPTFQDELIAPHHIRTRRLSKLFPSSENIILEKRIDHTAVRNQQKSAFYPNTGAMELVKLQANIASIQTNKENKVEVKNDLTNRKQNNLNMPIIDVTRLADQVYQVIERKIKVERQRRGMF
ncbi:hypothetical protein PQG02_32895 (plasmid) [Nostoc sp. UHCC 0926]|uniref:hypothetical protein n=1 Tax=Nostoc sp. UHCC 0926 TaxID=3025190 RepID=UPI0023625410|nr:hypothetical protein [Nostoc sp. UHCC 0926]WDD36388.1 hypothetical protein PQG02_32895 [Nostoc sp. UHCC 0926]